MPKYIILLILSVVFTQTLTAQSQSEISDKIVAVVNDHIILKSEVDNRTAEFMQSQQGMPFSEELWYDVLESMIDNLVMVEKAKIDSVVVTDDEVNRQLDQRIRLLTQRAGGEQQLERALGRSIVQLRARIS